MVVLSPAALFVGVCHDCIGGKSPKFLDFWEYEGFSGLVSDTWWTIKINTFIWPQFWGSVPCIDLRFDLMTLSRHFKTIQQRLNKVL